jgi:predicted DNA-binding transcriptional regulator AlpA
VNARGLAAMLSGSIRWVRTQDAAGKLPKPVRVAGRVLWLRDEIEAWLKAGAPDRNTWDAMKAARVK